MVADLGIAIETPLALDYSRLWLPTLSLEWIVFKVRTCKDARVLLSTVTGATQADRYEVHLGANDNSVCVVYKDNIQGTTDVFDVKIVNYLYLIDDKLKSQVLYKIRNYVHRCIFCAGLTRYVNFVTSGRIC